MKLNHKNKVAQNQKRKTYGKARKRAISGPSGYRERSVFESHMGGGIGSFFTPLPSSAAVWQR